MEKKKLLIIVAVAALAVILILAGAAAAVLGGGNSYASLVADGYRLIEEGDFNGALLAFENAIAKDPAQEEAYVGLYNLYVKTGNYQEALNAVRRGVAAVNSVRLNSICQELEAYTNKLNDNNAQQGQGSQQVNNGQNEEKNNNPVLNEPLLATFSAANFGDYCAQYGAVTSNVENNRYHIRLAALPATLIYFDTASARVIDQSKGQPYNAYMPNEIKLDNVMTLFGGGSSITYMTMKNLSGVSNPSQDGTTVKFTYGKCEVNITCSQDGVITANSDNTIVILESAQSVGANKLSLTIIDATTGSPVYGAHVKAYAGYGISGTPVEGSTDAMGAVSLDLAQNGTYTLQVTKDGYIEENFEEYILAGVNIKTLSISPAMSGNAIRFVLTWSGSPTDLDCHLRGRASDGTYVNLNYSNMRVTNGSGQTVAELDVDDLDGFGPETVTLNDSAGEFEFIVTDFTGSGTMSYSQAQVKIYVGSSLYTTIDVPAGLNNGWHVCRIVNGEIVITNTTQSTNGGYPS